MKTIEDLEKEYEVYKIQTDFVDSSTDFDFYLKLTKKDLKDDLVFILKEFLRSKLIAEKEFIKSRFMFDTEADPYLYLEDAEVLVSISEMIKKFMEYFDQIKEITEEDNYMELLKLADFTAEAYNEHFSYYDTKRDTIEYTHKGYSYYNSKYDNYESEFDKFFNSQIRQHKVRKAVEKLKKI